MQDIADRVSGSYLWEDTLTVTHAYMLPALAVVAEAPVKHPVVHLVDVLG